MVTKEIVILANSYKPGGRCVAGVELLDDGDQGDWIRPVSAHEGHGLSDRERRYADRSEPALLDIVTVQLVRHVPLGFQVENWLVDGSTRFRSDRYVPRQGLETLVDLPAALWANGHSTNYGVNDFVPEQLAQKGRGSLFLIQVPGVEIWSRTNDFSGKPEWWSEFRYGGTLYRLKVTDPIYRDRYNDIDGKRYVIENPYLTVSLGEPFHEKCSKLVAAIIEPEEYDE